MTMEEAIWWEVEAIKELCGADCYSLEQMISGIKAKCDSILKTLEEGDPK